MKKFRSGVALLLAALLIIPAVPVSAEEISAEEIITEVQPSQITFNTGMCEVRVADSSEEVTENAEIQTVYFAEDGSYTINIPEADPFFPYEVQFKHDGVITNEWFMSPADSIEVAGHTFYVNAYNTNDKAVRSITLSVDGKDVVVYPEEKEFINDQGAFYSVDSVAGPFDFYPATDDTVKTLTVDLSSFNPISLLNVDTKVIFADQSIADSSSVIWKRYNGDLEVTEYGNGVNLFYGYSSNTWTMYVGQADQLDSSNKHFQIYAKYNSDISKWLKPVLYTQDEFGNRTPATMTSHSIYQSSMNFYDNNGVVYAVDNNQLNDYCNWKIDASRRSEKVYLGYEIDQSFFSESNYSSIKVFAGYYPTSDYLEKLEHYSSYEGEDIKYMVMPDDMSQTNAGIDLAATSIPPAYSWSGTYASTRFTIVTYDSNGNINGIAPISNSIWLNYGASDQGEVSYSVSSYNIKTADGSSLSNYSSGYSENSDGTKIFNIKPAVGYSLDDSYKLSFYITKYSSGNTIYSYNPESGIDITAAYAGAEYYDSIVAANDAGAIDIKDQLIYNSNNYSTVGYLANYKDGVCFTVFIGNDGDPDQKILKFQAFIKENYMSSSTSFTLYSIGTVDADGDYSRIPSYMVSNTVDSYGEYNYWTLLVDSDADLSNVVFDFSSYAKVYVAGISAPLEAKKTAINLSSGNIQLTMSAEDGSSSRNIWLHVVKMQNGDAPLYINSLNAAESLTSTGDDGIIRTTREIMLDSYHDNVHDIVFVNPGTNNYENITATLESDTLKLDSFYGFNGTYPLRGYGGSDTLNTSLYSSNNEAPQNVAKVRLGAKDGVTSGTISGTLTISSGDKTLMIITLTGVVGDPQIITTSLVDAVKYVPYGIMIQNSNKYSWIKTSYTIYQSDPTDSTYDGVTHYRLPAGMELKPNGELYGVPTEPGIFKFTIGLSLSGSYNWTGSTQSVNTTKVVTLTLNVNENTDENVDNSTDTGYELSTRISSVYTGDNASAYFMVSQGTFDQFVDFYLDGKKLSAGTDYNAEPGSTRITIMAQTLQDVGAGTHTLAIEFRNSSQELKKAAQNVNVDPEGSGETENSDESGEPENNNNSDNGGDSANNNSENSSNVSSSDNSSSTSAPAPATVTETSTAATTVATTYDIPYIVQKGDTLSSISLKVYGSAAFWNLIYENNKSVLKNPNQIYTGMVLMIKTFVPVTVPVTTDVPAAVPVSVPVTTDTSLPITATVTPSGTYTVKRGDCLYNIAVQVYGNGNLWKKIFDANQNILKDPQTIHAGMVLVIPE